MSRRPSGKKNQPRKHKGPAEGSHDASYNRGEAGKRRKPAGKPSGKASDIGSGSSEFADTGH